MGEHRRRPGEKKQAGAVLSTEAQVQQDGSGDSVDVWRHAFFLTHAADNAVVNVEPRAVDFHVDERSSDMGRSRVLSEQRVSESANSLTFLKPLRRKLVSVLFQLSRVGFGRRSLLCLKPGTDRRVKSHRFFCRPDVVRAARQKSRSKCLCR